MLDLKGIRERLRKAKLPVSIDDREALVRFLNSDEAGSYHKATKELQGYAKQDITSLLSEVEKLRETLRVAGEALSGASTKAYTCKCGEFGEHYTCDMHLDIDRALSQIKTQL